MCKANFQDIAIHSTKWDKTMLRELIHEFGLEIKVFVSNVHNIF